jgi:hypothetical protein
MCNLYDLTEAKRPFATCSARSVIARATCHSSLRSSLINTRQLFVMGQAASASLSWRVGACLAVRNSAALRSRTSATSGARTGEAGSGNRVHCPGDVVLRIRGHEAAQDAKMVRA